VTVPVAVAVGGAVVGAAERDGVGDGLDADGDGDRDGVGFTDGAGGAGSGEVAAPDGDRDAELTGASGMLARMSSGSAVSRVGVR